MANLMITTACNFRCPYCFGLDLFGPQQKRQQMPLNLFYEILDWIDRGQCQGIDVHLMGGEPTLHPAFSQMMEEIVRRGRKLAIFSNAATTLDTAVFRRSAELGATWIVNCNPPATYQPEALQRLREHLTVLGPAAVITFNVTDGTTSYAHVIEYIERYGLKRNLKLGIALPTLENRNVHAEWDQLPAIARHVLQLLRAARERQITAEFECGVPYCLFDEAQHAELKDISVSHCGSRLDITPAGDVINCLPLVRMAAVPFRRFEHYRQAREWFQRMQAPYRQVGCASHCLDCEYRLAGLCSACLAFGISEYSRISLPPLPANLPPGAGQPKANPLTR